MNIRYHTIFDNYWTIQNTILITIPVENIDY